MAVFLSILCDFIYCPSLSLAWTNELALTNTLAYYRIRTLIMLNVFVSQAPGVILAKLFSLSLPIR
jgi:hypothetical protein